MHTAPWHIVTTWGLLSLTLAEEEDVFATLPEEHAIRPTSLLIKFVDLIGPLLEAHTQIDVGTAIIHSAGDLQSAVFLM